MFLKPFFRTSSPSSWNRSDSTMSNFWQDKQPSDNLFIFEKYKIITFKQ